MNYAKPGRSHKCILKWTVHTKTVIIYSVCSKRAHLYIVHGSARLQDPLTELGGRVVAYSLLETMIKFGCNVWKNAFILNKQYSSSYIKSCSKWVNCSTESCTDCVHGMFFSGPDLPFSAEWLDCHNEPRATIVKTNQQWCYCTHN